LVSIKRLWVTISTDEYESMKATIEVLSDRELCGQLRNSDEDIKKGRTKKWDDVVKGIKS
jgi:PHD/YefM family antitoxin component YafN of YafNO toxin-antitoxin module